MLGIDPHDPPTTLRAAAKEAPDAETTGELVKSMWQTAPSGDALDAWAPSEMSKAVDSTRAFRWTAIVPIALLLAAAVAAVVILPGMAGRAASARAADYRSSLAELRTALPDAQSALAVATEPDVDDTTLGATAAPLGELVGRAAAVTRAGNEPLPSAPPLFSSVAIRDLAPFRSRLGPIGAEGTAIAERISAIADYREELRRLAVLPDLPDAAASSEISELSVTLASSLADGLAIVRELPADAALATHRRLLGEFLDFFGTWQADYLDALRQGDSASATQLVDALQSWRSDIDRELSSPLALVRSEVDAKILALAEAIDALADEIPE